MIYTGGRKQGMLQAAVVTKPKGLKGQVTLHILGNAPAQYASLTRLYLEREGGFVPMEIEKVSLGSDVTVQFAAVRDRDAAEALRGARLYFAPGEEPPLDAGEYYIADLIGCQVVDTAGACVGTLREVMALGAADVYSVQRLQGGTVLFPAIRRLLVQVDVAQRCIVVDATALQEVAVYED